MNNCSVCGTSIGIFDSKCASCRYEKHSTAIETAADEVLLTTTDTIPGSEITHVLGLVSAECVLTMHSFRETLSALSVKPGRETRLEGLFKEGRDFCITAIRKEAALKGANCITGLRFDYGEISYMSMSFVVASGTAVKCLKVENR